jgi:hypothetical protein
MQRPHFGEFMNERNRVLRHTALTTEQTIILKSLWVVFPAACCDKIDPNLTPNTPPLGAGMVY